MSNSQKMKYLFLSESGTSGNNHCETFLFGYFKKFFRFWTVPIFSRMKFIAVVTKTFLSTQSLGERVYPNCSAVMFLPNSFLLHFFLPEVFFLAVFAVFLTSSTIRSGMTASTFLGSSKVIILSSLEFSESN